MLPQCVSLPGAAQALGISKSQIYRLIKEGRLRSIKIGRRNVVPLASIQCFIDHSMGHDVVGGSSDRDDSAQTA